MKIYKILSLFFLFLILSNISALGLIRSPTEFSLTGNLTKFTDLIDTPSSIVAEQCLRGNIAGTALEFFACPSGGGVTSTYNATYAIWAYNQTQNSDNDWILRNSSMDFIFNESKLATTYYNATSYQLVFGTNGGSVSDTQHQDGNYDGVTLNFTERVTAPALDVRFNFTDGITDFTQGIMRYKTTPLAGDSPLIQLWDYDDLAWEDYDSLMETPNFRTIEQSVFDSSGHVQDGTVQMRIYKSGTGNTNNEYYIDWLAIAKGFGTPAGEEVDPYSIHKDGTTQVTANISFNPFDVIANKFYGSYNWTVNFLSSYVFGSFDGGTLNINFNDSLLNYTIDNRGEINSWSSTYNSTYDGIVQFGYNHTLAVDNLYGNEYRSTYNSTYDSLTGGSGTNYWSAGTNIYNTTMTGLGLGTSSDTAMLNVNGTIEVINQSNGAKGTISNNGTALIFS